MNEQNYYMRKLTVLLLFWGVSFGQLQAQDIAVDSILKILDSYKETDSVRLKMLLDVNKYLIRRDIDQAYAYAHESFQLAQKLKMTRLEAAATQHLGIIYKRMQQYDSAKLFFQSALEIFQEDQYPKDRLGILISLGNLSKSTNQLTEAIKFYNEALIIAEKLNSIRGIAVGNKCIADIYLIQRNYKQALPYYYKALQITPSKKLQMRSVFLGNLAATYIYMKQYDSAKVYLAQSIVLKQKIKDTRGMALNYTSMASIQEGEAQIDSAYFYQKKAHSLLVPLKNRIEILQSLNNLISFSTKLRRFDEAEAYAKDAKQIAEEIQNHVLLEKYYKYRFKLDSTKGDFRNAIESYRKRIQYKDSTLNAKNTELINDIQAKYETEKKDAELKEFAQKQFISELEAKRKNQLIMIGSVAFVAIIGGLFFWSRQKSTKERAERAEIEQRFLRSQLNPHFIFNALDSIQSFVIANDPIQASNYMSNFAKLMRQVLENSREKFISLDEEISMLENYMELQRLQTANDFTYEVEVDEHIDPEFTSIPPMFVQPFVENAIEHGVIQGNGRITVNFTKEDDLINISVLDNGVGLTASLGHTKASSHNSLASSIIKERIDQYNEKLKTNIQVLISEITGEENHVLGTKVELKVPFQLT